MAAATRGSRVELVGRTGDDAAGDALLLTLGRAGVGHAAMLRDAARATSIVAAPDATERDDADLDPSSTLDGAGDSATDGPPLEAADVALGLRYLTEFAVLVLTDDVPADALPVAIDAAGYASAHLVVLVHAGEAAPTGLPGASTVLVAPEARDEGAFAAVVGAYAAALDAGRSPGEAFQAAATDAGWEPAPPDG